jgi:hypothetical protein
MTWAVNRPRHGQRWEDATLPATGTGGAVRAGWAGLLTVLLGAWGAIVAFVGPEFGYRATATGSWQWTTTNWLLHLVPGAVGVVAGLLILSWAPGWASARARGALGLAALLTVAAGAWFVIGPALWPWFESSAAYGPASDAQTSFVNQVGANLGPGILLAVLGGMALKTATTGSAGPELSPEQEPAPPAE